MSKTELTVRAIKLNVLKTLLDYMGRDNHHVTIKVETSYHTETFNFQDDKELSSRLSTMLASEAFRTDQEIEKIEFPIEETTEELFGNKTAQEEMAASHQVTNVSGDDNYDKSLPF